MKIAVFIQDKAAAMRAANELNRLVCRRYPEYNATIRDFSELRDFNAYPGNGNMDAYVLQINKCGGNDPGYAIAKRLRQTGLNNCLFTFIVPDANCLLSLMRERLAPIYIFTGRADEEGLGVLADELIKNATLRDFVEFVYDYRKYIINVRNIIYVMTSDTHTIFVCTNGTFESTDRMSTVEKKLPSYFVRVDKGYLINLNHLDSADSAKQKAEMTGGNFVYMSRRGTKRLFDITSGIVPESAEVGDEE